MSVPPSQSANTVTTASDPFDPTERVVWERKEGETGAAWAAFTRFRDAGPTRSFIEAYRQETGRNQASQPSGQWTGWYQNFDWKARAAAYDQHMDRVTRQANEAEHISELRSLRDRQRKLSAAATEASISLLKLANARLKEIKPENIPVQSLPQFIRAAAATGTVATNAEAESLGIDQLLKQLDEQGDNATEAD